MFTDLKYIGFLGVRLRNFTKKDSRLFNFSCPICGDSTKDKRKARGYFFAHKSRMWMKCHKCGIAMPFSRFLEQFDGSMYQEFRNERLQSKYGYSGRPKSTGPTVPKFDTAKRLETSLKKTRITDYMQNMAEMPSKWRRYLVARKIPPEILWEYFYYTDDFKSLANRVCPGTFSKKACKHKEARIVILLIDASGEIAGIQGREVTKSYAKYVTIKVSEESRKIFGLDRIKRNQPVFVLEGPIDSAFVDNGIGVTGADLVSQVAGLKINPVFVYDNEPRSPIIKKKIETAIASGKSVVIFPPSVEEKDLNDMVLKGVDVNKLLRERTFRGLRAKVELNKWKRTL